ncbi:MAG: anti-sigma factor domain-containing protein [Clostridiales bacterium]|nr:anti-sigma factor domain-containing protein [Clostridiales bacterium]
MKERSRAIIVEIRGASAAALTSGGAFVRVPNNGYELGQEIRLPESAAPARRRARITALASMAAGFLLLLLGGFTSYMTPSGVVSLDVNPSIEYAINCYDRVLNVTAVNDDGGQILARMDLPSLRYRPVDEAVEATISALRESGYLAEATENDVMLSAAAYSAQHAEQLTKRLSAQVSLQNGLTVYSASVTRGDVDAAHALGTSAGKLYLIERLGEASGEGTAFDPEDWVDRPVREIIALTKGKSDKEKTNNGDDGKPKEQTNPAKQNDDADGNGAGLPANGGGQSGSQPQQGQGGGPKAP